MMTNLPTTKRLCTLMLWLTINLFLWLSATVSAQTVLEHGSPIVKLDFDGSLNNEGSTNNPEYASLASFLWGNEDIPNLTDALGTEDGRSTIMLTRGQAVEFDENTTQHLTSAPNNKLRFSMKFKVENLFEHPGVGRHRIPLFSLMNHWAGLDKLGKGIGFQIVFERQDNGQGRIKMFGKDGRTDRGRYVLLFENVDVNTWLKLDLVLDLNDETITAQLNDQYFQLSLGDTLHVNRIISQNLLSDMDARGNVRLRVGFHGKTIEKADVFLFEAHLFVDEFIADNDTPEVDHEAYQDLLGDLTDALTYPNRYDLDDLYVNQFLPYLVFATEGFYLDQNETVVNEFRNAYETSNADALFSNRSTVLQLHKYPVLDRVLTILQHDIVTTHYNADDLADVAPLVFKSREPFPGVVAGIENAPDSVDVYPKVLATYTEFPGVDKNWPAHRPTGYWARAGKQIRVCIPPAAVQAGLDVIVGAHPPLKLSRPTNRDFTITTAFRFDTETGCTHVANPYGGGIYVRVPQNVELGSIDVDISGAVVKSPLYENRQGPLRPYGRKRSKNAAFQAWMNETSPMPPWADYISHNVMFTVPTNAARLVDDSRAVLDKWDDWYQAVTVFQGYEGQLSHKWRPRPEYLVVDSVAYCSGCAGYWMTLPTWTAGQSIDSRTNANGKWTYTHGLGVFNISKDPDFSQRRRFDHALHEKGHNLRHPINGAETESQPNIIKLVGRPAVFGDSWEEALLYHNTQNLTLEEATMEWMIMDSFLDIYSREDWRSRADVSLPKLGTMPDRAYQSRPNIKYLDLARLYGGGWEAVGSIYKEFYKTAEWQDPEVLKKNSGDAAFVEMATRAFEKPTNTHLQGENPLPLLEFWGIIPPSEDTTLQTRGNALAQSEAIKARLEYYQSLVPQDKEEFYETYSHLINIRGAIATRTLFTNAWQNYETATFGPHTGYKAAIHARFAQIFEDYFGETSTLAPSNVDINFRAEFSTRCSSRYDVLDGKHHVILCNDSGEQVVIKTIDIQNSAGDTIFTRGLEAHNNFWAGAELEIRASTAALTEATNTLSNKTITWRFTFVTNGVPQTCSVDAAANQDRAILVRVDSATNCTVQSK